MTLRSNDQYIPQKQDIVYIDFDPSTGKEINKRRPAVVVSNRLYSLKTGFVAVCPITNGAKHLLDQGLLVPVVSKSKVDRAVSKFKPLNLLSRTGNKINGICAVKCVLS